MLNTFFEFLFSKVQVLFIGMAMPVYPFRFACPDCTGVPEPQAMQCLLADVHM